jgi:hypothetical protein
MICGSSVRVRSGVSMPLTSSKQSRYARGRVGLLGLADESNGRCSGETEDVTLMTSVMPSRSNR